MNGGELQAKVIDLGHMNGWRFAHFRSVKTKLRGGGFKYMTPVGADGKGFPDLLCLHPGVGALLFREIKGKYEKLSHEQELWRDWLCLGKQDWGIWRPDDWPIIVNTLTFGRGAPS